jgi:hypothetical protein
MNGSTSDARSALGDLFQLHFGSFRFGSHGWLPPLLGALTVGALAVLLGAILYGRTDVGYVSPLFRHGLAYRAVLCWMVSTLCAYAGGFVMGRLYAPKT